MKVAASLFFVFVTATLAVSAQAQEETGHPIPDEVEEILAAVGVAQDEARESYSWVSSIHRELENIVPEFRLMYPEGFPSLLTCESQECDAEFWEDSQISEGMDEVSDSWEAFQAGHEAQSAALYAALEAAYEARAAITERYLAREAREHLGEARALLQTALELHGSLVERGIEMEKKAREVRNHVRSIQRDIEVTGPSFVQIRQP